MCVSGLKERAMGRLCRFCGMESDEERVCTWCGKVLEHVSPRPHADAGERMSLPALRRFVYPWWVVLSALGIVGAASYAVWLLPPYAVAARHLHDAWAAYEARDYDRSIRLYSEVLEFAPASRAALIGKVEALFSKGDGADDRAALDMLNGVTLDEDEWTRITKVMPAEYQRYFAKTTSPP